MADPFYLKRLMIELFLAAFQSRSFFQGVAPSILLIFLTHVDRAETTLESSILRGFLSPPFIDLFHLFRDQSYRILLYDHHKMET